jgi:hypothetical protein
LKEACFSAAALLCFIDSSVMSPLMVGIFKSDFEPKQFEWVGPEEAAIFRTPEGTLYNDPFQKDSSSSITKSNAKDHDVLKWEAELREQLEAKKGTQRKLTPEQQAKVKMQLEKEEAIRQRIYDLNLRLERGIGLIRGLATGPPTESLLWMAPAITSMVQAVQTGASFLKGEELTAAYVACSQKISDRLGVSRALVGIATLRALEQAYIPENYHEEPLGGIKEYQSICFRLR